MIWGYWADCEQFVDGEFEDEERDAEVESLKLPEAWRESNADGEVENLAEWRKDLK